MEKNLGHLDGIKRHTPAQQHVAQRNGFLLRLDANPREAPTSFSWWKRQCTNAYPFVGWEWPSHPGGFQIAQQQGNQVRACAGRAICSLGKIQPSALFLTQPTDPYFPDLACADRMVLGLWIYIAPLNLLHAPNSQISAHSNQNGSCLLLASLLCSSQK